jgi:hypothetical protein
MILNSYAILDAFVTLLRGLAGLLVVVLGLFAWWKGRGLLMPESRKALEDRGTLLFLLSFLLVALNLVSWPLLYLLLQSYVPEWPGVMCIYGVTQIGVGSLGPSRFLPKLLEILEFTKPLLVFAGGGWFVLYLINRRTATAPLHNQIIAGIIGLGALAVLDASVETAYLAIPKKEKFLAAGCCTEVFDAQGQSRFLPNALFQEDHRWLLYAAYYGINGFLIVALFAGRWLNAAVYPVVLGLLLLIAILATAVSGIFLIEIASPILLHQPYHHCPYDLVPRVPESVLAVALFLWGTFAVGWSWVAVWFGRYHETEAFLCHVVRQMMLMACWSYLASLVMMSVEITLA